MDFKILMIIGAGGFLGTISRFLAAKYVQNLLPATFPYGTFTVNIVGCFLIGLFYGISEKGGLAAEWRLFLTVGFCGGFTTFSSFANENLTLLREGDFFYFMLYTGLSIFIGILVTFLGKISIKIF